MAEYELNSPLWYKMVEFDNSPCALAATLAVVVKYCLNSWITVPLLITLDLHAYLGCLKTATNSIGSSTKKFNISSASLYSSPPSATFVSPRRYVGLLLQSVTSVINCCEITVGDKIESIGAKNNQFVRSFRKNSTRPDASRHGFVAFWRLGRWLFSRFRVHCLFLTSSKVSVRVLPPDDADLRTVQCIAPANFWYLSFLSHSISTPFLVLFFPIVFIVSMNF